MERSVAILGDMIGQSVELIVHNRDSSRKYQVKSSGRLFGDYLYTFVEIFDQVQFALTALRMAQNTSKQFTTVIVKDDDLNTIETYTFRGHISLAEAEKIAIGAEVFKMTTDDDYTEEEARAFLEESAEFEALHLTIK